MRTLKVLGIVIAALFVAVVVSVTAGILAEDDQSAEYQASIQSFYDLPNPLPAGKPGDIIRSEVYPEYTSFLQGATVYRVLYLTTTPDGKPAASSGLVFVPTAKSATPKRPVVAYAHGTSGFGPSCAPSRDPNTPVAMPWVQNMMNLGWVMTATDYTGLGTVGNPYFLVGQSEAADVVNSVRAARNLQGSDAGSSFTVMGHSQGGHSALWTGELSGKIAPELKLLGVSASAPAAELGALMNEQWNKPISWALGPDVLVSWQKVFPNLNIDGVTSEEGLKHYQDVAYKCVTTSIIGGQIGALADVLPFSKNPATVPGWGSVVQEQTPPPLPKSMPVQVNETIADGIVLANTNALLQQKWCKAGSELWMNWMGEIVSGPEAPNLNHQHTILTAWPSMTNWMQQRFQGIAPVNNCTTTPPVAPATEPVFAQ